MSMSYRTVVASSFDEYLASDEDSIEECASQVVDRNARLTRFPYSVMLKVSFPELDFANRWCWQNFGPCDGECMQRDSEYLACDRADSHSHVGKWTSYFFDKTDYNFGFNEWYFAEIADRDQFFASVDKINWGENYPK
jgi:hypothetical protein